MSLRVLVAPDKFKGTLSADAAAGAIANGWWSVRPHDQLECLPISDGGDGFGEILGRLLGATEKKTMTVDAAHQPREALWWWQAETGTAIIESAQIIGLALLPPNRFHPFELDSKGLGAVLRDTLAAGATRIFVGIGGSATNDGGFGLARSIGWEFFDPNGMPIERWIQLDRLDRWRTVSLIPDGVEVVVAVDVSNPLLGPLGCTRVYGPQKGLRMEQAPLAEACLEKLARQALQEYSVNLAEEAGAGAAGGLGFGFRAFVGARLEPGFHVFAEHSKLHERVAQSDVVLTGEGMIDRSTAMGKGTGQLAQMCAAAGKPCVGFAGILDSAMPVGSSNRLFFAQYGMAPTLTSPAEARANPALWLERLAAKVAQQHDW